MPGFVYGSQEKFDQHNDGEVPPVGLHRAECSAVSDVFSYQSKMYGDKDAIRIEWTCAMKSDSKGRPFVVSKRYNVKLDKGGNIIIDTRPDTKQSLGKDIQSWKPTIKADIAELVGQKCQVLVMHKPKDNGGTFANISSILPDVASETATKRDDLPF